MSNWHICPTCSGEGKHSIALGVINRDEWDFEELDSYMAGGYDSRCKTCQGSGKITSDQLEAYEPVRSYSTDREYYYRREGGY
jgi:DnaJ-class molecular chaperone